MSIALLGRSTSAQSRSITFGTASEGGGFVIYAAAFLEAMRSIDPTFEIRPVTTRGTLQNIPMLEAGEVDIGMVFGEAAHELFAGIGRPPTKLRVVSVMYSTPGMFVVRAESRYRTISDLKGRAVVWNSRGSGLAIQGRYAMDGLGLDAEKDFVPIYTEKLTEGPQLVIDGSAAALWGGGSRWPGFVTVANSSRGARFVVPTAAEIARIIARHPFMKKLTVPASQYRGQYDPIDTVGSWSFILARADLDDAIGYRIARSMHMAERSGQFTKHLAETTIKNTMAAVENPELLQPGVARYYKELGLLK